MYLNIKQLGDCHGFSARNNSSKEKPRNDRDATFRSGLINGRRQAPPLRYVCFLLIAVFLLSSPLSAQAQELSFDFANVPLQPQPQEKSARTAMLMSAIFPGAGQFYVDKKSITAYIFPVIEIGLWYSYFSLYKKGDKATRDFENYADAHYSRQEQGRIQQALINWVYTKEDFRLDDTNTQHYYEDLGKYDKYIFGWDDWRQNYEKDGIINWLVTDDGNNTWYGNYNHLTGQNDMPSYSANRMTYVRMRLDANNNYKNADTMGYFIVLNHALSVADAYRVTKKHNKRVNVSSGYTMGVVNERLVPMLSLIASF
jgi:hypothetical protein